MPRPLVRRAVCLLALAAPVVPCDGSAAQTLQPPPGATASDTGHAATAFDSISRALIERFAATLRADAAEDSVGAMAGAVVMGDSVVWMGAFGARDRASGAAADTRTLFRIGSITKTITGLALARLVDRGVVDLEDPVTRWVPEARRLAGLSPAHRPITLRDLATHTGGLAREPFASHAGRGSVRRWRERLQAALPTTEVVAAPGERYLYSNIGYALLGLALERAADEPYERLVRDLVLAPLGMRGASFAPGRSARRRLAAGYVNVGADSVDPRVPRAEHRGRGYRVPGEGLYATIEDMARLATALGGAAPDTAVAGAIERALEEGRRAAGWEGPDGRRLDPDAPVAGSRSAYGLGVHLHRIGDAVLAGHSGTVPGYASYLLVDPETRIGVVLLRAYNRGETNLGAAAAGLLLELREASLPDASP